MSLSPYVGRSALAPFVLLFALATVGTGCALWRGVVEPMAPETEAPETGDEFHVASIRDLREFELGVGGAWEPRLHRGDPEDEQLTQRVIGRRRRLSQSRSDPRPRLGNILLPEGLSVQQLVSATVVAGFHRAGLRAAAGGPSAQPSGAPIDIEIRGFWSRSFPTLSVLRFESWIQLYVRAPGTPFVDGAPICAVGRVTSAGEGAAMWRQAVESALEDLADRLEVALRDGPPGYCVSP